MAAFFSAVGATFLLGVVYFLASVPTGMAMGLPALVACVAAWAGYTAIGAAMLGVGGPARAWLTKRFGIRLEHDPKKLFWRVWGRYGLPGLALIAPVTCGPYFAVLIALALGERPARVIAWVSGGVIPWCLIFALLTSFGFSFSPKQSHSFPVKPDRLDRPAEIGEWIDSTASTFPRIGNQVIETFLSADDHKMRHAARIAEPGNDRVSFQQIPIDQKMGRQILVVGDQIRRL